MFSGSGSLLTYEIALASVLYVNTAPEPSVETIRTVQFQVFDDRFASEPLAGFIVISLVDDNALLLDCGAGFFNFTEQSSSPVPLARLLSLSDLDKDHMILEATVNISNAQPGDEIAVNASLSSDVRVDPGSDMAQINLVGEAMAVEYQVRTSD